MLAYADQNRQAMGGELRPGNAGSNTAADQTEVAEHAIAQIPAAHIENIELLLREDTAGAMRKLLAWAREHGFATRSFRTSASRSAPRAG
jgi:hypothetical protein